MFIQIAALGVGALMVVVLGNITTQLIVHQQLAAHTISSIHHCWRKICQQKQCFSASIANDCFQNSVV
jgi:hypothetical protein